MTELFLRLCEDAPVAVVLAFVALNAVLIIVAAGLVGLLRRLFTAQHIDTGDTVRHRPTGEEWVVAYVQGDRLAWCGWPEGTAALADCELIKKATPEGRRDWLEAIAKSGPGPRQRHAQRVLEQEVGSNG